MSTRSTGPVQCTPWCCRGDGHPGAFFRGDQYCFSAADYIALSSDEDGSLTAYARRNIDKPPVVELHVYEYKGIDETIQLTAVEALQLAGVLLTAALHLVPADGS